MTLSWRLPWNTNVPLLYHIVCSASVNISNATYDHKVETQTQASTFSVTLPQLLPSTAYKCCVSTDAHVQNLTACSSITTGESAGNSATASNCYSSAVGGGLGALVVILLLLLIGIIVYLKFSQKTKVADHGHNSAFVG